MVLRGRPPPRGYLPVPSVRPEEHGIQRPVPHPPSGPHAGQAQPSVHLHHQGEGLIPQRVQGSCPSPGPRGGPPLPLALAPPAAPVPAAPAPRPSPSPAKAIRAGSALGAGGAGWCWGRGDWGGDESGLML